MKRTMPRYIPGVGYEFNGTTDAVEFPPRRMSNEQLGWRLVVACSLLVMFAMILTALFTIASAQTTNYYGPQGWQGMTTQQGPITSYYGPQGWQGMATQQGLNVQYYGPQGQWLGMSNGQQVQPQLMNPWMPAPFVWGR